MPPRKIRPFLVAALLAASGVAGASPSVAEREAARRFMDEGKAHLKANDIGRAIESFQKAHEIMHVPTTGLALARAHAAAGHLVEAREAALEVARMPRQPGDPPVFDAARKHARELDAQLKSRIPTLRLRVTGGAPTRVAVDDVEIPPAGLGEPVAVNPGRRVVTAKGADGEVKREIELAERDAKELELPLGAPEIAKSPAAKPSQGSSGSPRAVVGFGNDDDRDATGDRTTFAEVLMYGGFGLGAVGLGVGGVTGAMTFSKAADVDPLCENGICAPEAKRDLDRASTLADVSTIAFVAGGVGVALGVVGYFLPRRPRAPAARAVWRWTPAGRGAAGGRAAIWIGPVGSGVGGVF